MLNQNSEQLQARPENSTFKNNGKKIKTLNGFMISYHGIFFFTDEKITERRPWRITEKHGMLPCPQEWSRLQKDHNLVIEEMNAEEEASAKKIADSISGDPMTWLTKKELNGFLKRKMGTRSILVKPC